MTAGKVLVVEDDPVVVLDLQECLQGMGYKASFATTGAQAVKEAQRFRPNVVLMDIKLDNSIDGVQAGKLIRQTSDVPIVFLTAYADPDTVKHAATVAPDGYIVKPFKEQELAAAIYLAMHRPRYQAPFRFPKLSTSSQGEAEEITTAGNVRIDPIRHYVFCKDRKIKLTPKEFAILRYLVEHKGYPIHPEYLLTAAWGPQFIHYIQALRVHINNLRKKLTPDSGVVIEPVRGVGYRLIEVS